MNRKEEVEIIIEKLVEQVAKEGAYTPLLRDRIIENGKLLEKYKAELGELNNEE